MGEASGRGRKLGGVRMLTMRLRGRGEGINVWRYTNDASYDLGCGLTRMDGVGVLGCVIP